MRSTKRSGGTWRMSPAAGLMLTGLTLATSALFGCQSLDRVANIDRVPRPPATVSREHSGRPPAVTAGEARPAPTAASRSEARTPGLASVERAKLLQDQGMVDQALAEFERAISENPRLVRAYMGAGDIYREKGDFATAEQRYGRAAELEPQNFSAQYLHGLTLQLLNRVSDAVVAYLRALSIRPDDFNANLNLGTAYLQLGEPQQALPYARRAVELNGRDGPARANLGAVYSSLARHEEAVIEYQQAAELMELSGPLLLNLADGLARTNRHEEAVNTLRQLIRTSPSAVAQERLGASLFRLRDYAAALEAFRSALEIDPNHYPALNGVGVCLLNQWVFSNQTDEQARQEALAALRRSLQIERNQPRILELIGRYQ